MDSGFSEFLQTPQSRFLPTWVLFLLLSVLRMFRLFEAVRGRLIGPKTWDRIDKIFGRKNGVVVAAPRLIWCEKMGIVVLIMYWYGKRPGMAV